MSNLIDKLRQLLGPSSHPVPACVNVPLDEASLERLMHILDETRNDELTCEEVFNCLDEYVDCLEAYQDVGGKKPLVEHHLNMCPDCRVQLDALIHALENATASDADD
ncbi:MAG: hypothetical protein KA586_06805 [Candidatus Promineofilum sp.]|nr:hypothetical protein [Promineifilum sp.]